MHPERDVAPEVRTGFARSGDLDIAYQVLGGIQHNADALCSFFNPTVNSYKRINAPRTVSGATWAPNTITWTGNNRTHMIRVPDEGRFELRLADGSTNPYLLQAGIVASGLDGIDNKRDPGKRLDINMYTEGHTVKGGRKLPLNLLDALRLTDASKVVREQFEHLFGRALTAQEYSKLRDHGRIHAERQGAAVAYEADLAVCATEGACSRMRGGSGGSAASVSAQPARSHTSPQIASPSPLPFGSRRRASSKTWNLPPQSAKSALRTSGSVPSTTLYSSPGARVSTSLVYRSSFLVTVYNRPPPSTGLPRPWNR